MQKGNNKKKKASFERRADCEIPCTKVIGYTETNNPGFRDKIKANAV